MTDTPAAPLPPRPEPARTIGQAVDTYVAEHGDRCLQCGRYIPTAASVEQLNTDIARLKAAEAPLPSEPQSDEQWALERLTRQCASALVNAQVFGKKLLKGFGYPDESFCYAQDYKALSIVLELVAQLRQALAESAEERDRLRSDLNDSATRRELLKQSLDRALQDVNNRDITLGTLRQTLAKSEKRAAEREAIITRQAEEIARLTATGRYEGES